MELLSDFYSLLLDYTRYDDIVTIGILRLVLAVAVPPCYHPTIKWPVSAARLLASCTTQLLCMLAF